MSQIISMSWDSVHPYALQVGGHTETFFELPDGTLMKLVKVGEIEFYSDIIRRLPQLPDFIPLCYGHGVLPARPGVDKAPRDFIVLQNVVGAMKLPSVIDIKLGTRSYSLHDTPAKQEYQLAKDLESTTCQHGLRLVACKGPTLTLGKEVCKYKFSQVSDTVAAFTRDFSQAQQQHLQRELDRIAVWLSSCPFEFIGSSILIAHDAHTTDIDSLHVKLIDFGHVEEASGEANAGNVLGVRTLQQILQQCVQAAPPAAAAPQ